MLCCHTAAMKASRKYIIVFWTCLSYIYLKRFYHLCWRALKFINWGCEQQTVREDVFLYVFQKLRI
jgi:hypothetical protein